uniref:Uncharacterized protein n=1 Tax=Knipowitschia caucasica TaxID=637954 RepID=A0AAV2MKQ3_KNICA
MYKMIECTVHRKQRRKRHGTPILAHAEIHYQGGCQRRCSTGGGALFRSSSSAPALPLQLFGSTPRPRLHAPAPAPRPGPGFTSRSRPRLHVPAPASRPGPGFTSRPRLHVPAPASRPGPGFTCRLHPPGPSYGPPPPSLVLFLGRLGSVP